MLKLSYHTRMLESHRSLSSQKQVKVLWSAVRRPFASATNRSCNFLQVMNEVQYGVIATSKYWVFSQRSATSANKEMLFSIKVPPSLNIVHHGQRITLRILLASELWHATMNGQKLAQDSWTLPPDDTAHWTMKWGPSERSWRNQNKV